MIPLADIELELPETNLCRTWIPITLYVIMANANFFVLAWIYWCRRPKSDGWEFLLGKGRAFHCLQRMNKIDLKIKYIYIYRQSTTRTPQIVKSCHPEWEENMEGQNYILLEQIIDFFHQWLINISIVDININSWSICQCWLIELSIDNFINWHIHTNFHFSFLIQWDFHQSLNLLIYLSKKSES